MSISLLNRTIPLPAPRTGLDLPVGDRLRNLGGAARMLLPAIAVFMALIAAWQTLSANGVIKAFILPAPVAIVNALFNVHPVILDHARVTIMEALLAFTIGNSLAVLLAILFVHNASAERSLYPLALVARSIPVVAITPALVLWLGNGMEPKIVIGSFLVFFPTLVNMVRGLRSVDRDVMELLHSLSANRLQILWKVRLPAALPFLFSALRIAASTCFIAAIVAEWIGSDRGVGYLIVIYGTQFKIPEMWASVLVCSIMAILSFSTVCLAERLAMPWARFNESPTA
jgi:ABC-type nitrate/sulfonate/bicarbonate transport system permease component